MDFLDLLEGDVGYDGSEPERWLVEHEQPRLQHQTAADREHLLLTAAHCAGELLAPRREHGEDAENEVERTAAFGLCRRHVSADFQIFLHRHFRKDLAAFWHVGDAEFSHFVSRQGSDVEAAERDRARGEAMRPEIARKVVLLPAPFAPSSPTASPSPTAMLTPVSAGTAP